MTTRRSTKRIPVANLAIGGGEPVRVQSMLSLPPEQLEANIAQAVSLERAGCEILRVAIPDRTAVALIPALKEAVSMPVVADIHFDWRLALESAAAGADKIRINPGNIGGEDRVRAVALTCREKGIPIRIGVNSGSVERHILARYGSATPEARVESALSHAGLLERHDFGEIVLSMKTHHVGDMMAAYRLAAEKTDYPLHLGLTHTGSAGLGRLKSAIAIGGLLAEGIGDTLRVSLTDRPEAEIEAAREILRAVGLGDGPNIISCPTCGRTCVDVIGMTKRVEEALAGCGGGITVAVMGCAVNGPGEAREADIGITGGGNGKCALFRRGEVFATLPEAEAVSLLLAEISRIGI
jgi:(E)-4-hydroxy-3-methylbut-2-enyl-diphosphate synthase